jgi:hypothetical protein
VDFDLHSGFEGKLQIVLAVAEFNFCFVTRRWCHCRDFAGIHENAPWAFWSRAIMVDFNLNFPVSIIPSFALKIA